MAIGLSKKLGECGATTKKPRVLGLFDCVAHYEVNAVQGPYLSISGVDRLDGCRKVGIVVAYVYHDPQGRGSDSNGITYHDGHIISPGDALPCEELLKHCRPIVKVLEGWPDEPINSAKRAKDAPLPVGVQDLIGTIEHFTGATVISIGNGPGPDDLIYIKRKCDKVV